jgi:hypothetical protein
MSLSQHTLRRIFRVFLILVMLASQGAVTAHDLGADHIDCSDVCSLCVIGCGLDSSIDGCLTQVQPRPSSLQVVFHVIGDRYFGCVSFYLCRAPPKALKTI